MAVDTFLENVLDKLTEKGVTEFNFVSSYKHSFVYVAEANDLKLTIYLGGTGDDIYREQFNAKIPFEEFKERVWLCGFAIAQEGEQTFHYNGEGSWTLQS